MRSPDQQHSKFHLRDHRIIPPFSSPYHALLSAIKYSIFWYPSVYCIPLVTTNWYGIAWYFSIFDIKKNSFALAHWLLIMPLSRLNKANILSIPYASKMLKRSTTIKKTSCLEPHPEQPIISWPYPTRPTNSSIASSTTNSWTVFACGWYVWKSWQWRSTFCKATLTIPRDSSA